MINIHDIRLNKMIPVPLYYQLKQYFISKIQAGELKVGESLPTELEIAEALDISRTTIRQALSEMVNEGLLHREKGKGTFVAKPKIEEAFFQKLESFNDEMIRKGFKPQTKVLSIKSIPGQSNVNSRLNLRDTEMLIYLERLRYADSDPVVYLETYLSLNKFGSLLSENFADSSLYTILESKYGSKVTRVVRKIEAVNANNMESKLLNIKKNAAICLVRTIGYIEGNIPVEFSVARYRGDRNQFTLELVRV